MAERRALESNGGGVPIAESAKDLRITVIAARFNSWITDRMLEIALQRLEERGVGKESISVIRVPGAFELPYAAKMSLLQKPHTDSVLLLGAIIEGETAHFEHIARCTADGALRVSLEANKPVIFGVLTTYKIKEAVARISHAGTYADNAVEMGGKFPKLSVYVSEQKSANKLNIPFGTQVSTR